MRMTPLIIGVAALTAVAVQAGEIHAPAWPCTPTPLELTTIPVHMQIQPWVWVKDLEKLVIHLIRRSAYTYEGCIDVAFEARAPVNISAEFIPNGLVPGKYTCWLNSPDLDPPGGTLKVCVRLETEPSPPPPTDVQVGTVIFKITPKAW